MTGGSKAVFLSYASEDSEAAQRIADALKAAGIEVWIDKSELRGGDAWDQKIRQQIRECALFMPVISASAESRLEGYFRREWRLAVDRTLDMTKGMPFLMPVMIDATPERDAHVPEAFRSVRWTRPPRGEASPAFVARILQLLAPAGTNTAMQSQASIVAPVESTSSECRKYAIASSNPCWSLWFNAC